MSVFSRLHNRKQSANLNGYDSKYKLLECVVAQGFIFGILFKWSFCVGKDPKDFGHQINEEATNMNMLV